MSDELGFSDGIEHSHTALGARDLAEPSYRSWSETSNTYYPMVNDDKRPWCVFSGGKCDFSEFEAGQTRFAWDWTENQVEHTYRTNSVSPGIGALAVEAPKMLAWMNRYTVGATPTAPRQTAARCARIRTTTARRRRTRTPRGTTTAS